MVIGLSVATNKKSMFSLMEEMTRNRGFMWVLGMLALLIGAALIVLNNTLAYGLPLVATIVGWVALIKGCFLLLFPDSAASLYGKFNKSGIYTLWGVIIFLLGIVLLYLGFF